MLLKPVSYYPHKNVNPENPRKLSAKRPARIKAMGRPLKTDGIGARSTFSLAQLMRNKARANPKLDPRLKHNDSRNP